MTSAETAVEKQSDLTVILLFAQLDKQKCREVPGMIYFNKTKPRGKKGGKRKKIKADITEKGGKTSE